MTTTIICEFYPDELIGIKKVKVVHLRKCRFTVCKDKFDLRGGLSYDKARAFIGEYDINDFKRALLRVTSVKPYIIAEAHKYPRNFFKSRKHRVMHHRALKGHASTLFPNPFAPKPIGDDLMTLAYGGHITGTNPFEAIVREATVWN